MTGGTEANDEAGTAEAHGRPDDSMQQGAIVEFGRAWRRNLVFAAPADETRVRRPVDFASLAVSLVGVAVLGWMYTNRVLVDTRVLSVFNGIPSWLSGIAVAAFSLVGLYAVGLIIGVAFFAGGRIKIARDMVIAAFLAAVGVLAASYISGAGFPLVAPEFRELPSYPPFPLMRLSASLAAIGVVRPFLSVPMRRLGQRLIVAGALGALVLGYGTVTSVLAGCAMGVAAAAAVHIMFGSGQGIPSRSRIVAALDEIGLDAVNVTYLPKQPPGATLVRADLADGGRVFVKVFGRDAADAAFASRLWRAIWYRGESRGVLASRIQLAEREALILLVVERAGVPAVRLISGWRAATDDVVLVYQWVDVPPDDTPNLDATWSLLRSLHSSRIAHSSIDRDSVVSTIDGPVFRDLQSAELLADGEALAIDRAQLIVTSSIDAGIGPALDAATRALDRDELIATLPLLQLGILPRAVQLDVRERKFSIDDLRQEFCARLDIAKPELVQLRRVTWGSVAMVFLTVFAAYSLISSLTEIGFDSIADQYSTAIWGWIVVALVVAQLPNIGEYFTLSGVIGRPVPFGPTLMFRYAISFISLAVPSDAGAIAMSVRYQQKLGVPAAAALAQGPLLTIFSKTIDVVLLLITAQFVSRTVDTGEVDFGPVVWLVMIVVVAALVAIAVVAAVPKLRGRLVPHLKVGFAAVKGSLTDPHRLGMILAGTLFQKACFAIALSASVSAFGADLPFASSIFVNTAVSLFIGLVPVPGGIGIGESALTAGLIAVGVPPESALAAAITHRMLTAYLPPVFGWWASRWLTQRDYL
jgi:glycosyltransferase 2 family protein